MEKFRKKALIELVGITEKGFLVQNEGDSSDQWVIDPETFETTYEKVFEVSDSGECCCPEPSEYLLFEALKVTSASSVDDFEFREKVKAKLEKLLNL